MRQEYLYIKNFGPVKRAEIEDIKQFMFFVGESGSGKSTILKVLAMMRHIYKQLNLRSYLKLGNVTDKIFGLDMGEYFHKGGMKDYLCADTEFVYRNGDNEIAYTRRGGLSGTRNIIQAEQLSLEKISFMSDKRGAIASLLANNSDGAGLGFYFQETFKDFYEAINHIENIEMPFLNMRYHEKKQSGRRQFFIGNVEGTFDIHFEDASSGMQTTTPLAIIAEYYSKCFDIVREGNNSILKLLGRNDLLSSFKHNMNVGDIKKRSIHMIIEEPELSLFPKAQRSTINMLVRKCLSSKTRMTLAIATHSPYIINHLNLLMKAADKGVRIEGASLDYEKTGVYVVENGMLRDMKVKNAHLINTDYLSDDINDIYDTYNSLDKN